MLKKLFATYIYIHISVRWFLANYAFWSADFNKVEDKSSIENLKNYNRTNLSSYYFEIYSSGIFIVLIFGTFFSTYALIDVLTGLTFLDTSIYLKLFIVAILIGLDYYIREIKGISKYYEAKFYSLNRKERVFINFKSFLFMFLLFVYWIFGFYIHIIFTVPPGTYIFH